MTTRFALALLPIAALAACSSGATGIIAPERGAPPVTFFSPDVPAWRGGCFFEGAPGKIVNGSPAPDVRLFGHACDGTKDGVGGLVYLDRYDPVGGIGDVTVLPSTAGARPVVVARNGGSGSVLNGSASVRLNDSQTLLLTISELRFVTGTLQLVDLKTLAVRQFHPAATRVRVENFDFLPADTVVYVNNYDSDARQGDIMWQRAAGEAPVLVAAAASRWDSVIYRLSPDRTRIAYMQRFGATGGDLYVQRLPPSQPPAAPIARSVTGLAWTPDGSRLVYATANADGVTTDVWSWNPADASVKALGTQSIANVLSGGAVFVATGWNVLAQQATLSVVPADGGAADSVVASSVSRSFGARTPPGGGTGLLAFATVPPADPTTGTLWVAPLSGSTAGPPVQVEAGVSPAAGFQFSPSAAFVAYARGFHAPASNGNGDPQPGIADMVRVASASGAAFDLAPDGAFQRVAWDPSPGEPHAAGIASFEPAGGFGDLVVRRTADGAPVQAAPVAARVGAAQFDFTPDGSALVAIRGWDGGLRRGELVVIPTSGPSAWTPQVVPGGAGEGATFFAARGGRAVYGVRGDAHDGLWLAPAAQ
jgi:hypothetical protein